MVFKRQNNKINGWTLSYLRAHPFTLRQDWHKKHFSCVENMPVQMIKRSINQTSVRHSHSFCSKDYELAIVRLMKTFNDLKPLNSWLKSSCHNGNAGDSPLLCASNYANFYAARKKRDYVVMGIDERHSLVSYVYAAFTKEFQTKQPRFI